MTSATTKSLISTAAIVCCAGAVLAGISYRDKADLHLSAFNSLSGSRHILLASRGDETPDVSAADFFAQISELLKREYVDPINDDNKLATCAIRGMIASLEDPDCLFMDPKQYQVYANQRAGKYEGIGVDVTLEIPAKAAKTAPGAPQPLSSESPIGTRIPALVVAAVVPGGPADRAGIKPGDTVDSIDGHWVLNPYTLQRLKDASDRVKADTNPQQKASDTEKLKEIRKDIRKKIESSYMPLRARDRLISGTSGNLHVVWNRAGTMVDTTIAKAPSQEEAVSQEPNGAIALHFYPGAAAKLKSALPNGAVTLDLRNNAVGDYDEMRRCLADLAPAGTYGEIVNEKNKSTRSLAIQSGSRAHAVTIIADRSTRGVAEMFAKGLEAKGIAKVTGSPMSSNERLIETVKLPDGSGYTVVTGEYKEAQ